MIGMLSEQERNSVMRLTNANTILALMGRLQGARSRATTLEAKFNKPIRDLIVEP